MDHVKSTFWGVLKDKTLRLFNSDLSRSKCESPQRTSETMEGTTNGSRFLNQVLHLGS